MPPGKNSGYVDYDLESLSVGLMKKINIPLKLDSNFYTNPQTFLFPPLDQFWENNLSILLGI